METDPQLTTRRAIKRFIAASVANYGLEDGSGLPVSRSTGIEICSWMISQLPLILPYTSVTRIVRSIGCPLVSVPVRC
jgi:hypothetical protein